MRFAFSHAVVAFSREVELAQLVARIGVYPEDERTEKLITFASQLPVYFSYLLLAHYSHNPYLLAETALELVRYGGRLILAHSRLLYPGRKQFLRQIERASARPPTLLDRATELLRQPGIPSATACRECVEQFAEWPKAPEGAMARFQRDVEQPWRDGRAPLADR